MSVNETELRSPELQPELQLVVLISGRGSNAMAILDAIEQQRLHAKIRLRAVIADGSIEHPPAGLVGMAERGIDTAQIDPGSHANRAGFEQALTEAIQSYRPDLIALAGFMRVLSADFVERFAGRIVNIHPSLLPRYRGLNTHQRAIDAGDKRHGASVHWVTAELDGGPVIARAELSIQPDDTADRLAARVLTQEHRLYPACLALLAQNGVSNQHDSSSQPFAQNWLLDRDFDDTGRVLAAAYRAQH